MTSAPQAPTPPQDPLPLDPVFAPPGPAWQRVHPDLATVETISVPIGWGLFVLGSVVPCAIWAPQWVTALVVAVWVVFLGWRVWAVRRHARSWGYAQNETDLYVTHGIMFRELSVVPYGRMQVVEVNAGPLQRRYGLATVTMTTASSGGTVSIPGLTADEAARLRDELSRFGEAQAAGL